MSAFPISMKPVIRISSIGLLLLGSLVFPGCSTSSPNPSHPHAHTGYVDFYTDSNMELSWEVKLFDAQTAELEKVFSVNRVTEGPQFVDVQVENGKVTPVHVTLAPAGTTSVDRKVYGFRPSAKGYGRGTKVVTSGEDVFRMGLTAETPKPYQTKEKMPYWSLGAK